MSDLSKFDPNKLVRAFSNMNEFIIACDDDKVHDLLEMQNWFIPLEIPQKINFFCLDLGYLHSRQTENIHVGTLCATILESIPKLDRFKIMFANHENDIRRIFNAIFNFNSKKLLLKTLEINVNWSIVKKDVDDICNILQKIKNVPYLSKIELKFTGTCAYWITEWEIRSFSGWKCKHTCSEDQLLFIFEKICINKDINDDNDIRMKE